VALGSNLPGCFATPEALLDAALARFGGRGLVIEARSSVWRSAAWPNASAPAFLNMAALVATDLSPEEALRVLLKLEREFGRVREAANAPRTLDLDLIDHDGRRLIGAGLVLPHPRAHERLFVMGPLAEIAPGWRHPVLGRTAAELAAAATVGLDARPVLPRCNMGA
jgi:2-amino-4-hydroxy-6-hydroxymethyldihydropteridine diphosphokinase